MLWLIGIMLVLLVIAHHGPGSLRTVLKRTLQAITILIVLAVAYYVFVIAFLQNPVHP